MTIFFPYVHSLNSPAVCPSDTHVWAIATRYYLPALKGKSLTKKVHEEVQAAFEDRFGSYSGWCHNTLFIAELASQQERCVLSGVFLGISNAVSRSQATCGTKDRGLRQGFKEEKEGIGSGRLVTASASCRRRPELW